MTTLANRFGTPAEIEAWCESAAARIEKLERELALVGADTVNARATALLARAQAAEQRADKAEGTLTFLWAALEGEQARAERYRRRLARLCWWVTPRVRPGWRGWGVWSRTMNDPPSDVPFGEALRRFHATAGHGLCSRCGSERIALDREGTKFGACTLAPGLDGTGGCPDPLYDYNQEHSNDGT